MARSAGRPKKATVDYFPHMCVHGPTMFILEERFGNDGYAFWFKLLETLGATDGHFIDCGNPATWEFLMSKTRQSEDFCTGILDLLAKLSAIDPELWASKIVWCQNFVDGVAAAYTKRGTEIPSRPLFLVQKPKHRRVSGARNPQTILDETKLNETREGESTDVDPLTANDLASLWNEVCGNLLPKVSKLTGKRKQHANARLAEKDRSPDWWRAYFARIAASSFCRGENQRGWRADFDFATRSEDVVVSVLEGKYDNRKPAAPNADKPAPVDDTPMAEYLERLGVKDEGRYSPV